MLRLALSTWKLETSWPPWSQDNCLAWDIAAYPRCGVSVSWHYKDCPQVGPVQDGPSTYTLTPTYTTLLPDHAIELDEPYSSHCESANCQSDWKTLFTQSPFPAVFQPLPLTLNFVGIEGCQNWLTVTRGRGEGGGAICTQKNCPPQAGEQ